MTFVVPPRPPMTAAQKQIAALQREAKKRKREAIEATFIERLVAAGAPEPVRELRFHPARRWRFDFAWPAEMLALEVEGGVFQMGRHTRGVGFLGDMAKYNAATELGWRLLRCTPKDLGTHALVDRVVANIPR